MEWIGVVPDSQRGSQWNGDSHTRAKEREGEREGEGGRERERPRPTYRQRDALLSKDKDLSFRLLRKGNSNIHSKVSYAV